MGLLSKLRDVFLGIPGHSVEECKRLQAIARDPDNTELYLQYADWLIEQGNSWGEFIAADIQLERLPENDPDRDRYEAKWSELYRDGAKRLFRRLKRLGLRPQIAGMFHPSMWMKHGVINKVTIDCDGVLPERVTELMAAAPGLQRLHFFGIQVKPGWGSNQLVDYHPDFSRLLNLPALKQISALEFSSLFLKVEDLKAIAEASFTLRVLDIDAIDAEADPSIVQVLATAKSLKSLRIFNLSRVEIPSDTLIAFLNSENLDGLEEFRFDGCQLDASVMTPFASSTKFRNLKILECRGWPLGVDGAKCLADSPVLTNLRTLDLGKTMPGPEGAKSLAMSSILTSVQTLKFNENEIGTDGATALAASPYLRQLQILNLCDNEIGPEGLRALAESDVMKSVQKLDLDNNPITDAGLEALAKSSKLDALTELSLFSCQLTGKSVKALLDAKWLKQLKELSLGYNDLGVEGVTLILQSNKLANLDSIALYEVGELPEQLVNDLKNRFGDSVYLD